MGYRIVRMTGEFFEQMFAEGYTMPTREGERLRTTKGLPLGARLVSVSNQLYFTTNEIALKFSHPSWDDVPPGHAIPELRVEWAVEPLPAAFREVDFAGTFDEVAARLKGAENARKVLLMGADEGEPPHVVGAGK